MLFKYSSFKRQFLLRRESALHDRLTVSLPTGNMAAGFVLEYWMTVCKSFILAAEPRLKNHSSIVYQIFYMLCGSVFLWQQCGMLCTSCFVDDVMFSYNAGNRQESKTTRVFHPVHQVAAPVRRQKLVGIARWQHRGEVCHFLRHLVHSIVSRTEVITNNEVTKRMGTTQVGDPTENWKESPASSLSRWG